MSFPSGDLHWARQHPEQVKRGGEHFRRREEHLQAKLSEADVIEIRKSYAHHYFTMRELAEIFDVTATQMCRIIHHRTWTHVA
jgi:hypothetical protein